MFLDYLRVSFKNWISSKINSWLHTHACPLSNLYIILYVFFGHVPVYNLLSKFFLNELNNIIKYLFYTFKMYRCNLYFIIKDNVISSTYKLL